jgi:N-acetylglucosaminyl-diphospho-decaprenol L-rhamnosyltransferase
VERSPSCSIVVLNYNGVKHLRHLLPTIREAVARHPTPVPVVVVDNRSTEPDVAYVHENFPEFEVVVAERNDYLFSLNPIVAARPEDVVILLNNDMRVAPDFIAPLLEHMEDPEVLAAIPAVLDWEGEAYTTGQRVPNVRRYWFHERHDAAVTRTSYTLAAGCGAMRRTHFIALGGYDPLYRPGYWEDMDLSYRGWARGWKCVYEPRSVIYHRVGGTFGEQPELQHHLYHRNRFLFVAKNVGGWGFVLTYLALLPVRIVRDLFRERNRAQARGIWSGLSRLPQALRARLAERRVPRRSHEEIAAAIRRPPDSASRYAQVA